MAAGHGHTPNIPGEADDVASALAAIAANADDAAPGVEQVVVADERTGVEPVGTALGRDFRLLPAQDGRKRYRAMPGEEMCSVFTALNQEEY
jgi:protein involved in temperature-dependent protein secretion